MRFRERSEESVRKGEFGRERSVIVRFQFCFECHHVQTPRGLCGVPSQNVAFVD